MFWFYIRNEYTVGWKCRNLLKNIVLIQYLFGKSRIVERKVYS